MGEDWNAHPREDCYFCGKGSDVLESHHIIPRRFGGSDGDRNKVALCPTCHRKLERLYDKRFYDGLGVRKEPNSDMPFCDYCEQNRAVGQVYWAQINETNFYCDECGDPTERQEVA